MAVENENLDRGQNPEAEKNRQEEIGNRKEASNAPESGWEAGQNISNKQFIAQHDDEDQNGTERGPSDAGIGMEEIRKKQKQQESE